ncbi:MAG: hypothetical protein KatS3mg112_0853 [Thermogutta sp.]|nr:MAG: hypothetical protein KatS3mg112_0853 [Thermogutta sp.]
MKCPNCGSDLDPLTGVCPQCQGATSTAQATGATSTSDGGTERGPKRGDPDIELWKASYSPRGMIGTWITLGIITIIVIVVDILLMQSPLKDNAGLLWGITLGLIALAWLVFLAIAWYRKMTIQYRLTTYRFYHQKGFIFRTVDSMEVIDIDDIAMHQNLLERLVGVGRVILRTKDTSDPILILHGVPNPLEAFKKLDKARRDEQIRRSIKIQ